MHNGIYSNYQRGFITGSILASIVAGVLTILSFKHGLSDISSKVADAFNEGGHSIFINLLRGLKNDTAATVEKIGSIIHNVKKDPAEPDPDASTGEIKGPTDSVRSGNTAEDRNESNAKGEAEHKEKGRKYRDRLPENETLANKFISILNHCKTHVDNFIYVPEGQNRAELSELYRQVVEELQTRSHELTTYDQSGRGRTGSDRVHQEALILDAVFEKKGFKVRDYKGESDYSTFEQTVKPLKTELPSRTGKKPGNIYTDRTYENPLTGQLITVETVDTSGSLTDPDNLLGLNKRERNHRDLLAMRQPNVPIFAIPKMKK